MKIGDLPVVAICGHARSGKTTAGGFLVERGWLRLPLASPLKHMLGAGLGLTQEQLWGDDKQQPIDWLGGISSRQLQQTLGTEWGRVMVHPEVWLRLWFRQFEAVCERSDKPVGVLVDDLRFVNELMFIRRQIEHVKTLAIIRPSGVHFPTDTHVSETEFERLIPMVDEIIVNSGGLDRLKLAVNTATLWEQFDGR